MLKEKKRGIGALALHYSQHHALPPFFRFSQNFGPATAMPLPLLPVIAALSAGGTLVPHAAGGLIVTAGAGGYVTGTYLSTAVIASIFTAATATTGIGLAAVTGAASAIVGSAGIFGTTVGATGLTGVLMSAGIVPATPIIVPVSIAGATFGCAALAIYIVRLRAKATSAQPGQELQFSEREARVIERLIRLLAKRQAGQEKAENE